MFISVWTFSESIFIAPDSATSLMARGPSAAKD